MFSFSSLLILFYGAIFHSHSECYQYTYFNIFRTICYFHFNTVKSSICCGFIRFFSMVFCFIVYYNLFLKAQVIGPIIFSWYPGICLILPITNMNFSSDSSNQFCGMEKNGCIEYHMLKMAEDLLARVSELNCWDLPPRSVHLLNIVTWARDRLLLFWVIICLRHCHQKLGSWTNGRSDLTFHVF